MTQAHALLKSALSNGGASKIGSRHDLAELARAQGLGFIVIEFPDDSGDDIELVILTDGSCFLAEHDGGYQMDPLFNLSRDIENCSDIFQLDLGLLNKVALPDRFTGISFTMDELEEYEAGCDLLRAIATEVTDPPERLRSYLVTPEEDLRWDDMFGQGLAEDLIASCVQFYAPGTCDINIFGDCSQGVTEYQKQNDASTLQFLAQHNKQTAGVERDYSILYSNAAYADFSDHEAGFEVTHKVEPLLHWFSAKVLAEVGQPVGHTTIYNDGAYNRISGYSTTGASHVLELEAYSNHQRLQSARRLAEWLADNELLDEFNKRAQKAGLEPLKAPDQLDAKDAEILPDPS
jgi:hypothetical protein